MFKNTAIWAPKVTYAVIRTNIKLSRWVTINTEVDMTEYIGGSVSALNLTISIIFPTIDWLNIGKIQPILKRIFVSCKTFIFLLKYNTKIIEKKTVQNIGNESQQKVLKYEIFLSQSLWLSTGNKESLKLLNVSKVKTVARVFPNYCFGFFMERHTTAYYKNTGCCFKRTKFTNKIISFSKL